MVGHFESKTDDFAKVGNFESRAEELPKVGNFELRSDELPKDEFFFIELMIELMICS